MCITSNNTPQKDEVIGAWPVIGPSTLNDVVCGPEWIWHCPCHNGDVFMSMFIVIGTHFMEHTHTMGLGLGFSKEQIL